MVLRLILVSLVAGLSFDMPTRRDLDTMARSAQHWVQTRLAEWDPQAPSDYETYVLVADPAPTPLPTAAPVAVPDDEFASVLNDNVALFAQDELAGTTREMDQFVKSSDQLTAVEPSKSFAIELPTEPATVVSEEWIATDITEIAFEGWAEEATPSNPVDVAVAAPVPQLDLAFEGVIEETVINFALDATTLAKSERSSDNDSLEAEENLSTSETDTLNQITSNGIEESIPSAIETGRTENRLTNAVRLTREAVVAWASLLHGPAVVTIAP
ncbi:hypothetical protein [Singulisphaera acidiphila]|uniref:Uncharacterized protein n=1 Tax=Singulisphaera acidiphila (strain ATCC BAA-1392 / DSM 18658 / VKM B-2454 / MOB10) TaxID=886293 RepID=L0DA81_SINAD|nr:hypothetical protein [Singulisphaera acidiphila]AGA26157.1 hypothetical protein Sinac_1786 [Singulisphaera acidiphila DSM 18658]